MEKMEIKLRTLTPLWTGGVDQTSDRLHETGLIGSLCWWYEALVRGLGGYACDPISRHERCEYDPKKKEPPEKQLCPACYLFGCTGWARKFRLQAIDTNGKIIKDPLAAPNIEFVLRFVELRPMVDAEKWLLARTVWIAATYGALGGKTTLKPQKDLMKGADYGIVQWVNVSPQARKPNNLNEYLSQFRQTKVSMPDLRWFFSVQGAFLWRKQINNLIGLSENGQRVVGNALYQEFLRGRRGDAHHDAISKKIFSFRVEERIWGYARDAAMRDEIISHIRSELGQASYIVKTGEEVLNEL